MSSTKTMIESGGSGEIHSVAFHPDGIHLSSASADGFRRWRLADGQEVGNQIGFMSLNAISVSRDNRWIVCGTWLGAGVWDAESQEMTVEVVEGTNVLAVDISPDSTRFATGTAVATRYGNKASIWDIVTGERLVHPLQHDGMIVGVKFSPDGERVATACRESIRVFDSYNGDQLQVITVMPAVTVQSRVTPFAWSNDGQQIFALSLDNKIKSFKVSSGIKLAESQIQDVVSIALAANGKFLAAIADRSVTFWDTSTLSQIGPVIEDTEKVWSIAVSPDCSYLATGGSYGRITIRNLSDILLDAYGPFHVTPQQQLEQPSTLGNHDKRPSDSTPEQPITEVHRKNGDEDLFGVSV
ncbi:tricorn protease domain 2-containing protein [Imleria badia]|nr:tricorn protease domain 2-containing protein [Imleria badia]